MEQRPPNRAERRAQNKRGRPPKMLREASPRPPLHVLSEPPGLGTAGSDGLEAETVATMQAPANDKPPAGQGAKAARSHHVGSGKRARVQETWIGLHVIGGGLVRPLDEITSDCVIQSTNALTGGWMQLYDVSAVDRAWMDKYLTGSRWTAYLVIAMSYITLTGAILKAHGTDVSDWFKPKQPAPPSEGPERPSGATAPATGPSEPPQTPLGAIPEEGLPHDVELLVRQISRETGRPYDEVRAAALAQMAEFTATQNGASGQMPRALGEVIG